MLEACAMVILFYGVYRQEPQELIYPFETQALCEASLRTSVVSGTRISGAVVQNNTISTGNRNTVFAFCHCEQPEEQPQ